MINLIEITTDEVVLWHDFVIQNSNIEFGTTEDSHCRDMKGLDGCIQGVFQGSSFVKNGYLNLPIEKMAGLLLYRIAEGQYFVNGNKRIALVATETFLKKNGYGLSYDDQEVSDLIISFAQPMNSITPRKTESDSIRFIEDSLYVIL